MKKVILILTLLTSFTLTSYSVNPEGVKSFETISKENLWKAINELNIKHPQVVFAQAILETGSFTSYVFKTNNNLFGMKMPGVRPTVAKKPAKKGGYAKYTSWQESVVDYSLYQSYIFSKKGELTQTSYLKYLDKVYCQSTGYSQKLKRIIQSNKQIFNS